MPQSTSGLASASPSIAGASIGSRINLRSAVCRAAEAVIAWQQRAYDRRLLAAMDERQRRDIGLARVDVWREVNKPFWRD